MLPCPLENHLYLLTVAASMRSFSHLAPPPFTAAPRRIKLAVTELLKAIADASLRPSGAT